MNIFIGGAIHKVYKDFACTVKISTNAAGPFILISQHSHTEAAGCLAASRRENGSGMGTNLTFRYE
jgi:hypothetical protein